MPRFKMVNGQRIQFTADEEAKRDAQEQAWLSSRPSALESAMTRLRAKRNRLLTESDWTQSPDSPLTDEKKTEWATYRTSLRNLTNGLTTVDQVNGVTWPTKPN